MTRQELQQVFPVLEKIYKLIGKTDEDKKDDKKQKSAFQRQVDLIPAWRELKQTHDEIEEKRQELGTQLNEEKKKLDEEFKDSKTGEVSDKNPKYIQKFNDIQGKYNQEFNNWLAADIGKVGKSLKFTQDEVWNAWKEGRVENTEIALIWEGFIR